MHYHSGIPLDSTHPEPIRDRTGNEGEDYGHHLSSPSVQLRPQRNETRVRDEVDRRMRRTSVGVAQAPSWDSVVQTTVSIRGVWLTQNDEISRLRAQVAALRQQVQALHQSHWDENGYGEPPPMYSSGPPSST